MQRRGREERAPQQQEQPEQELPQPPEGQEIAKPEERDVRQEVPERHRLHGSERDVEEVRTSTRTVELPDGAEQERVYYQQKSEIQEQNEARQERLRRNQSQDDTE